MKSAVDVSARWLKLDEMCARVLRRDGEEYSGVRGSPGCQDGGYRAAVGLSQIIEGPLKFQAIGCRPLLESCENSAWSAFEQWTMNGSQTGLLRAVQLSPAGWPASSSTGSASWCCRTISTSPVSLWRSLDERQAALHRYDQSPAVVERRRQETAQRELRNQQKSWSKDGYNNARGSFVDDAPARNYRDHSYANDESQGAPFLQRKLRRNHRNRPQALGVFSDVQAIPDGEETHALHFKERRDVLTESTRSTASQKERDELKAKIKQSMASLRNFHTKRLL